MPTSRNEQLFTLQSFNQTFLNMVTSALGTHNEWKGRRNSSDQGPWQSYLEQRLWTTDGSDQFFNINNSCIKQRGHQVTQLFSSANWWQLKHCIQNALLDTSKAEAISQWRPPKIWSWNDSSMEKSLCFLRLILPCSMQYPELFQLNMLS